MNSRFLLVALLLTSCFALPAFCNIPEVSNGITMDIIEDIPLGRVQAINANVSLSNEKCYVTIYHNNVTIEKYIPFKPTDWDVPPMQCFLSYCTPKDKPYLMTDENGFLRENIPISMFKYATGNEYDLLLECGSNCAMKQFNVTYMSIEPVEYGIWNIVWSVSNEPIKYVQLIIYVILFISIFKFAYNLFKKSKLLAFIAIHFLPP